MPPPTAALEGCPHRRDSHQSSGPRTESGAHHCPSDSSRSGAFAASQESSLEVIGVARLLDSFGGRNWNNLLPVLIDSEHLAGVDHIGFGSAVRDRQVDRNDFSDGFADLGAQSDIVLRWS